MVVGACRRLMVEHWRLKPEALGSIPAAPLSFPMSFQRSSDSNGPDNLYRSSDLGELHLSGSLCCDEAQILSTHSNYYLSTKCHIHIGQLLLIESVTSYVQDQSLVIIHVLRT